MMLLVSLVLLALAGAQDAPALPSTPMAFGAFQATFGSNGTFSLEGQGWPAFRGTYKTGRRDDGKPGSTIEIVTPDAAGGCDKPARYGYRTEGSRVIFALVADDCAPRRMILDGSSWRPSTEPENITPGPIALTWLRRTRIAEASPQDGSWRSSLGPRASGVAEGQNLPDRWDAAKGENV